MTEITLPLHPLGWRPVPTCSVRIDVPETAPVRGCVCACVLGSKGFRWDAEQTSQV
eukprot:COSAG01_NODE_7050_length_3376_cov_2.174855_3_plen_56_part_00